MLTAQGNDLFFRNLFWNGKKTNLSLIRDEKGMCHVLVDAIRVSNGVLPAFSAHNRLPQSHYDFYGEETENPESGMLEHDLIAAGYLK